MQRQTAWELLCKYVSDPGLRRHMVAVEAAMRRYAEQLGGDPDLWGLAGLLHDFDWEIHPTLEQHPREGAPILRANGCPESVVRAILAHNTEGTGVERESDLEFALLACDEITGLIIAATLVRPHKDIRKIKNKSIKRNWKDKLFTAAVDRSHVQLAVEEFSAHSFEGKLQLWEHIGNVLQAMQGVAAELELDGRLAAS